MNPAAEVIVESVRFYSGEYLLEGELLYPESGLNGAIAIAGPHPMLGGDMKNNVVQVVSDELSERGFAVLRFNYRGVGDSQGPAIDVAKHLAQFWETSHISGELDFQLDLCAAWQFLNEAIPHTAPRFVLGYSFGCSLLPSLYRNRNLQALVLIAPTIGKHDYGAYASVAQPVLVIAPIDDFASEYAAVVDWYEKLPIPKQLVSTQRDGHFFRGHEAWLSTIITSFLTNESR